MTTFPETEEQWQLVCLLSLAEESMFLLLSDIVKGKQLKKNKTIVQTHQTDAGIAMSQILKFLPQSKPPKQKNEVCCLDAIEKHFRRTSENMYNGIFTASSLASASSCAKNSILVKNSVEIEKLDISGLKGVVRSVKNRIFQKLDM